ncbi:sugar ABC transporter substrate-binding protein [Rhizobium sp. NLR17b]|uniref:ABC transporter substrate-binding protein n=1 Tax=Rhizobium sp. NLR17b TaxID=2731114 RepID=UPI001C8368E1|nr:sugar ABC transporter substrate-binding protein [Rhizobium sp. NLR17b]MBX5272699.1 sugar ABC transporter substrate-binding protein [Rhizobium sp. NLR17b]
MKTKLLVAAIFALPVFGFAPQSFSADKIQLTFMSWEASPLESASIRAGLEDFKKANPDVDVTYVTAPFAQHHAKLRTMMAAGTAPDVFYLNPDYQRDFINNGQLLDLTEMFPKYWELKDFIASSQKKMQVDVDGQKRIYGVDVCTVGPVLYYNKKLFDEAKVPYPPTKLEDQWTWDQFVGYMKQLTKIENGKTVQYGTSNFEEGMNLYTTQEMVASNGAKWFNDDFTKAVGMDSPETRDALEKIKALRTSGLAPDPTSIGLDTTNSPTQMLLTGRVATLFMGSWGLQELAASKIELGAGLPPKMGGQFTPMSSCNIDAVWAGTKHPKEAVELVSFLTSMKFATPIYKSGLWMPNRLSMYEPEKLKTWYDPAVYPEGWINMKSLWTTSGLRWFDQITHADEVYNIMSDELQSFFYSNKPLDQVLPEAQSRVNEAMAQ